MKSWVVKKEMPSRLVPKTRGKTIDSVLSVYDADSTLQKKARMGNYYEDKFILDAF